MRKTKIICTLGPASDGEILERLMTSGMDCARFNMSHGDHAGHKERMDRVKALRAQLGLHTAILLDTKGPEIRLKNFPDGAVEIAEGATFTFYGDGRDGDGQGIGLSYGRLAAALKPGDRVMVDDGKMGFTVTQINGADVVCTADNDGKLKNHKSINLPNIDVDMPYISEADRADILFGIEQDVDFIAASFVRTPDDVLGLRRLLNENGGGNIQIIAKIENTRGVSNMQQIADIADGIMVARGDMGVELPFPEIPAIQKDIIEYCYKKGKHVVTATQMLESMVSNPRPTRAEVSDVANAVYDGTTAIMLSGESASGEYPVESLQAMVAIAERTEQSINYKKRFLRNELELDGDIPNAVASCACLASFTLDVAAVVAVTRSGYTARLVSCYRPGCPIIAPAVSEKACRQLNLTWGVHPILTGEQFDSASLFRIAETQARRTGLVGHNDLVVVTGSVANLRNTDFMHLLRL